MDFPDYVTVPELQEEILRLRAEVERLTAEIEQARKAARPRPAARRERD